MSFKGPYNINVVGRYPVRTFDGISGGETEVLRRFTSQGYDVSYTISNVMQDFDLSKNGTIRLRDGCRKTSNEGQAYAIDGISHVRVGGLLAYFMIVNAAMTIVSMPLTRSVRAKDGIDLTPATSISAPASEVVPNDPSYPL